MSNIQITCVHDKAVGDQPVEFVERKGKGHPDTLIDGIVERASEELSKAYTEKFGGVLHHNVDKGLIVGGESTATFGKGEILKPIEVIVAGRATRKVGSTEVPVDDIVINAAKEYLRENTRFLDLEKEVKFVTKIQKGSSDLNGVFKRTSSSPLANDTSFGIGFAPFSETEQLALQAERYLNSKEYKKKGPYVGEDIKVMAVREGDNITLTVAIAFVAKFVSSIDEYVDYKAKIRGDLEKLAKKYTSKNVEILINNGDSHKDGDVYLTKSGLSCESGDDGSVGRGNRVNGVITPYRHMTLEAAWGKNPINHTGKIYSIISNEIAKEAVKQFPDEILDCTVYMVSQIGRPINDPRNLNLELVLKDRKDLLRIEGKVRARAEEALEEMRHFPSDLIARKYDISG